MQSSLGIFTISFRSMFTKYALLVFCFDPFYILFKKTKNPIVLLKRSRRYRCLRPLKHLTAEAIQAVLC
jgi:hypothetical protein